MRIARDLILQFTPSAGEQDSWGRIFNHDTVTSTFKLVTVFLRVHQVHLAS